MNLDDQFFKNISSSESEVAAPPAWESFSSEVKRQNFKAAGFKHLNYFSLSVMILLFGGGIFAYFSRDAVSVKEDITPQQTIQHAEQVQTEQADPLANEDGTAVSDALEAGVATEEQTRSKQDKPLASKIIEHEQLHEPAVAQAEKKVEQAPVEASIEVSVPASLEQEDRADKLEKDLVLEGAVTEEVLAEPKKSGKKSIVFAADTVFEYDTVTVQKKNRRR